jgi:hypothetical protein
VSVRVCCGAVLMVVLAAGVIGLSSCGSTGGAVVARVAGVPISDAMVVHLARVLSREQVAPGSRGETLREYALALLITAEWVIGEARAQGVGVSEARAMVGVRRKIRGFPGGGGEFNSLNALSGRTFGDAVLAERVHLAVVGLLGLLARREPGVTPGQVAAYYREHERSFVTDEQRKAIVAHASSRSAAEAVKRELAAGMPLPFGVAEQLEYAQGWHPPNEDAIYDAVYAASAHVPLGPVRLAGEYFVFEVTQIIPSRQKSLAAVAGGIAGRLRAREHSRTLAGFTAAWRGRWLARTSCSRGWVLAQCREYTGVAPGGREAPFTAGS